MHEDLLLVVLPGPLRNQELVVLLYLALIFFKDGPRPLLDIGLIELHLDLDQDLLLHLFDVLPVVFELGLLQDLDHLLLLPDLLFFFL